MAEVAWYFLAGVLVGAVLAILVLWLWDCIEDAETLAQVMGTQDGADDDEPGGPDDLYVTGIDPY